MLKERISRKQMREVVYYANAWCDEYSGERPYKLKDFMELLSNLGKLERVRKVAQEIVTHDVWLIDMNDGSVFDAELRAALAALDGGC
jgi:hypothetical protein